MVGMTSTYSATYTVSGMTCNHCVNAVTEELNRLPEVARVDVDLPSGRVDIRSARPLAHDEVAAAVEEAGYALAD
jgi:copper chaperone